MRYAALLSAAGASEMAAGASEMLAVEDKLLEVIEQLEDPLIASSPTLKAELMKQAQLPPPVAQPRLVPWLCSCAERPGFLLSRSVAAKTRVTGCFGGNLAIWTRWW